MDASVVGVTLFVLVTGVSALAYLGLRGSWDAGPSGKARCRQCDQLFDNTRPTTAAMSAWREWGLVLCPSCAAKKGEI